MKKWICNECNFPNFTDSVPEEEIEQELHACINCGGFEFHLEERYPVVNVHNESDYEFKKRRAEEAKVEAFIKPFIYAQVTKGDDGQSDEYFKTHWLIWWGIMSTDTKIGLVRAFQEKEKQLEELKQQIKSFHSQKKP